ncbi:MAG: molybdopterin-dependent oxidoreductase [Actinomycetota bacterium]|nr:molybdopterin-dependent oxidoreductase [Actinomycetota bacterium]
MDEEPRRYGRRAFLGVVAAGLSALWWADGLARHAGGAASKLQALVPSQGWRIYTIADTMPTFDRASWRLRIDGLVERPLDLSYDDLLALPRAEQVSDFHCVTGWSVEDVRWAGVRFRDLLAPANPLPEAHALRFLSAEHPYEDTLTLEQAHLADAMLAYELDGKPLTRPHGAPARVVIPEMYGYKNVKWVERIELTARAADGYWERRGYDRDAWVGRSNGYA